VARTLNPPPRDFRTASAFKNGADEGAIAQTLATGIPGGGAMPLYAHLTDRERRSLALYVISLRTPTSLDSGTPP
jgi:mono/diheme cytochrome c family protein